MASGTIKKSGMTANLVWSNPSPASTFAGQSITLPSSDYDLVLVTYLYSRTAAYGGSSSLFAKGQNSSMQSINLYSSAIGAAVRRITSTNDTTITFGDCQFNETASASQTTDNNRNIPTAIYTIKF